MGERSEQQKAVQVIRNYYDAINRKDYDRAYVDWEQNGKASQQSFEQFKQGFANTASVTVELGTPGRIDAAAGSLYIETPVTIAATTVSGAREQFAGYYILRRGNNVPGSTPEQRTWHLYSASIHRVEL
jgi:hypothetical protein